MSRASRGSIHDSFKSAGRGLGLKLLKWYQSNRQDYPWRLQPTDPYRVWLSEVMLQQTGIKVVIPAYENFLRHLPNVTLLAAASEEKVAQLCAGLGYYRRFRFLHQGAKKLVSDAGGGPVVWPKTYEEWLALPGVGPYTGAAVSSIVLGHPRAVVDGNVERVLCRLLDIRLPPNLPSLKPGYQSRADELLVKKHPGDFNQALMELGQKVCTLAAPLCSQCPIRGGCFAYERGSTALSPQKKIKKKSVDVAVRMLVPVRGNLVGLWRRPKKARFLKEALGFPTFLENKEGAFCLDGVGVSLRQKKASFRGFKHTITHHRMAVEVSSGSFSGEELIWVKREKVLERLTSSLDAKCWRAYMSEKHS